MLFRFKPNFAVLINPLLFDFGLQRWSFQSFIYIQFHFSGIKGFLEV